MVLVGLGILIASLSFFVYRCPPSAWRVGFSALLEFLEEKRLGRKLVRTTIDDNDNNLENEVEAISISVSTPPEEEPSKAKPSQDADTKTETAVTSRHDEHVATSSSTSPLSRSTYMPPPALGSTLVTPQQHYSVSRRPPSFRNRLLAEAQPRRKLPPLLPGHSPLDWATFTHSASFPQFSPLQRITPAELHRHNGKNGMSAWTAYRGKVYDITPYLQYHPGGVGEIMRAVGKDAGRLFNEVHPWVSWDGILGKCCVGILVQEREKDIEESELERMD